MRTTLNLDPDLMRSAKAEAARTGKTLTSVIEDALRLSLGSIPATAVTAFDLPVSRGGRSPAWTLMTLQPFSISSKTMYLVENVRGSLVADAYHAALAIETGSTWITTDADFARFPGLNWRHPLEAP